jgi:NitT/TauT family transport system substrate-binding protein
MTTDDVLGDSTTFTMLSTTSAFHDAHPELYSAVLAALEEAQAMIREDPQTAAEILVRAGEGGGFTSAEIADVLADPDISFSTTPRNTKRYAEFMYDVGTISNAAESWRDLFFEELHGADGS